MELGKQKSESGFTVVETIVVMTIFLFTIGAVVSIFVSAVQNQRGILHQQGILNQMSYASEYISKALRVAKVDPAGDCMEDGNGGVGYVYLLTRPTESGLYRGIKFLNQSNLDENGNPICQEFFLDDSDEGYPVLKELQNSTNDEDAVALAGSEIQIERIGFAINGVNATLASGVRGATNQDGVQPRVTIAFIIAQGSGQNQTTQTVQTTISARNLNVQP